MRTKSGNKLQTKDYIVAGAFAALYAVLLFGTVTATGFMPVVYIFAPLILSIVLGTVYMLYIAKIPKRWSIMILAVLVGLLTSMGGMWFAFIWAVILGVIADTIANTGERTKKKYVLSYMVFACTNMGPFWALIIAKDKFLGVCTSYYGQDYADAIDRLTPPWIVAAFLAMALVGGLIGGLIGIKLLKKHFEKAGVV